VSTYPEIAANADRFDEMAAKHSELKSGKSHGGEYLLQGSGMFSPGDEEVLFSLKIGEISPVIDIQIMFAVYRIEDRQEVPAAEREEMRQNIITSLRDKKIGAHLAKIGKGHVYEVRAAALQQAVEEMLAFRRGDNAVVAVIDGAEVTFGDLRNSQARPPEAFYTTISAPGIAAAYQGYLESLMLNNTIAEEARKEGFKLKEPPGGDPMLWTILTRRIGNEILKEVSVTEPEVRAYYDANIPMFSRAEMYTVQKMQFSSREIAEIARKRVVDDPSLFAKVREAMSEAALAAHKAGKLQVSMGRGSDFFGPWALDSGFGDRVFFPALAGKAASFAGNLDVPHTATYIGDFGRALVVLGERREALGQAWHVPNDRPTITQREFAGMIFEQVGTEPRVSSVSKGMMRMAGLFIPGARETVEMMYEFEKPFVVNSSQFEATFGERATPLPQAIAATLNWYRAHPKA